MITSRISSANKLYVRTKKKVQSWVYIPEGISYRLRERRRRLERGCVSISFTWMPSVVLLTFFFPVVRPRFPFSSRLSLDSPTLYGQVVRLLQSLRLYKFYIIFMRHKVVEKATAERRKRVGGRARRCAKGKFLRVQTIPLGPVSPPPVGV